MAIEEQNEELETLLSIFYGQELTILSSEQPINIHISVFLDPETLTFLTNSEINDPDPRLILDIVFTKLYPDTAPICKIIQPQGLNSEELKLINTEISKAIIENLGMASIYTIFSCCKDLMEKITRERRESIIAIKTEKLRFEEEQEEIKFQGSKVSKESFVAWRTEFIIEMNRNNPIMDVKKGKLTGKQLFEKDKSLVKSDVALISENDILVDMDLFDSEFQGLEDEENENHVLEGFSDDDDD